MSPQLAFVEQPGKGLRVAAVPVDVGNQIGDELKDWLQRAVAEIGRKEVIDAVDTNKSTLSDALQEQNDRAPKGRWIAVIYAMATDSMRREFLRIFGLPAGYEPVAIKTMTPEEEVREMRAHMAREAPGALKSFDKEHRR